jgi:hypothetical protein
LFLVDTDAAKSIITFQSAVGMKMPISPHQVINVLRVYGDQLYQSKIFNQPEGIDAREPRRTSISAKTRRQIIIEGIASNIIKRITQTGPDEDIEKETFKKLENEDGKHLPTNTRGHNKLLFKKIDGNTESINSLSIEDSKFLMNTLRVITSGNQGGKK